MENKKIRELAKKAFEIIKNNKYEIDYETMHGGYHPSDEEVSKTVNYLENKISNLSISSVIDTTGALEDDLCDIDTEQEQIRNVVQTLVDNALNYSFGEDIEEMDNFKSIKGSVCFVVNLI